MPAVKRTVEKVATWRSQQQQQQQQPDEKKDEDDSQNVKPLLIKKQPASVTPKV